MPVQATRTCGSTANTKTCSALPPAERMASTWPSSIASTASENSLPAKPMQNSVSASAPGNMPNPSKATSRMVQIISWTERQAMMKRRATGYRKRRLGVML